MTITSQPRFLNAQAQAEPAGPPPTIKTSQVSMMGLQRSSLRTVQVRASPRHVVVLHARETDLEELQIAAQKRRDRRAQIQSPDPHEPHRKMTCDVVGRRLKAAMPFVQRLGVV